MLIYNYLTQKINGNIQVHTTGCELCVYDACKFASTLDPNEKAIVFNTCSFVEDRETENLMLSRILRKAYPDHKMYILGCDVNYHKDSFKDIGDVLLTNEEIKEIIETKDIKDVVVNENDIDPCLYIKIQDGCCHKCTFCIINQLRKHPYSVPYDTIVKDIKAQMAEKGCDKIALAGTETTIYYDKEKGYHLTDMIEHLIQDIPEIKRIIMNAFDPQPEETEKMIRLVGKYPKLFIPHVILAAQSGSDTILKAMGRRHNVDRIRYLHKVAEECNVTLGWDVIVGFPGETEELFMETYNLMKELHPFSQTLFTYSKREGTPAAEMPNQVPEEVKAERLRKIYDLKYENAEKFKEAFKNYSDYTEENTSFSQSKYNKLKAVEILQSEDSKEVYLDIFDEDAVAQFVLDRPQDVILHVNYDMNRQAESGIMVNFIKQMFKGMPFVVHVPPSFDEDIPLFENYYQCIVRKDNG